MLTADNIIKAFPGDAGPVTVLNGVSLAIGPGESVALTGESGSGKSTLLHIIAGLEPLDRGEVTLRGQALSGLKDDGRAALRRRHLGIIFQQFNLIPSLNVAANIAFQARLAGRHDGAWSDELTQRLGLADHVSKFPEALSGGQQQRVAIGRALAHRPAVILADEPTGNLDEATAADVLNLLLELAEDAGAALMVVTHSETVASRLSRRVHLRHGALSE